MKIYLWLYLALIACFTFTTITNAQSSNSLSIEDTSSINSDSIYITNDFSYGSDLNYWSSNNFEISKDNDKGYSDFIGVLLSPSNTSALEYKFVNSNLQQFAPGQILSIYLLVPADTSNIDSISVFLEFDKVVENDNDGIESIDYGINELKIGD